ncbi:MAG: hypothetical protein ABSH34_03715, partial [Verrucomicrobiota bacterium]
MNTPTFPYSYWCGHVHAQNPKCPEAVVACPEESVRVVVRENGLVLQEPICFGSWSGHTNTVRFQD